MNTIEKALMHALFFHLHHNIDKAIDFEAIEALNNQVSKIFPDALVVGPGDDAAVFKFPDTEGTFVAKMESHCSPCVPRPYDAAATGAGGAMRDHMVGEILLVARGIHAMRDPTRGGVAASLNEIAAQSDVGIVLIEEAIPIKEEVRSACEILGLDPLYVANEGKLLVFVPPEHTSRVLETARQNQHGRDAQIIGEVVADHPGRVVMRTRTGGTRIIDMPLGEQLPRIC